MRADLARAAGECLGNPRPDVGYAYDGIGAPWDVDAVMAQLQAAAVARGMPGMVRPVPAGPHVPDWLVGAPGRLVRPRGTKADDEGIPG